MRIKNVEKMVARILSVYPESRSDDFLLITYVYQDCVGANVDTKSFSDIMVNHLAYGLPSIHSISRTRRKLFNNYPELKPKKITEKRKEKEKEFKEYAR